MGLALINLITSYIPNTVKKDCIKREQIQKHLDKLKGIYNSFEKIKAKEMIYLDQDTATWKEIISPYLLYH
jgi:hypothetical protein